MNGAVVIAELKQEYLEVPVIAISSLFNSGYGMDAAARAAQTLAKPFERGELLRAVADYTRRQRPGTSRRSLQPARGAAGA